MSGSLSDLSRRERRRLAVVAIIRTALTIALLLVVYALVPVEPIATIDALTRLAVAVVIVVAVIAAQVLSIRSASHPELRAIEAVIIAICVFIILFALLYVGVAQSSPSNFGQPLNRVDAFYFTVTVLSTVGFGDISAKSQLARLMVTVQMLLDLALIAIIVRVFSSAARARRSQ
jgi:voltage-gated potassium channel